MADVTGDIGGQSVQLNNAATETTLRQLLEVMIAMATSTSKTKKLSDKEIKNLEEKLKKLSGQVSDTAKNINTENKKREETINQLKKTEVEFKKLTGTISNAVVGMSNLISSISKVGDSLTAAAGSLSVIPVVGGALSAALGAVAEAAERSVKSYQTAASAGATFGGSITEFNRHASRAGMTIEQFGNLIKSNSDGFLAFGNTTEQGAKRFGVVSERLRRTSNDLYALGFSTESLNQGLVSYGKQVRLQGRAGTMSNTELVAGAKKYLRELDLLAKITGETREEKEKEREALLKDAQFQASMAGLAPAVRESFLSVTQQVPEGMRNFAKDIMAVGTATTKENSLIMSQMPRSAAMLQEFHRKMQSGEAISMQERAKLNDLMALEGPAALKRIKYAGAADESLHSLVNALASTMKLQEGAVESGISAQDKATAGTDEQNKTLEEAKQKLTNFSNAFTEFLANSGLLDDLMTAFESFAGVIQTYLLPAAKFVADHFGKILAVATPLIGAFVTIKGLLVANSIKQALVNSKLGASLLPMAKFAIGLIAANGPLLLVTAAIGAVAWLFNELGGDTETLLSVFTYLGEWIKTAASGYKLAYYELMDWVGDYSKEIAETRKEIDEQAMRRQKTIDEAAKRMSDNRARREKENTKAVEDNTAAKKEETASLEEAADARAAGPDWSNPASVLKWYKEGGSTFKGITSSAGLSTQSPAVSATTSMSSAPLAGGVKGLLEQISRGEGTTDEQARKKGLASGYDVSLGYGAYGGGPKKAISEMSIAEVKEYQKAMLADPKNKWNSSAVGKYQIVGTTLRDLQKELGFKDTDKFDAAMQDKLGEALLKKRGLDKYMSGKMSDSDFQLSLAKEWASVADPRTGRGYYGNQQTAHTSTAAIQAAMSGLSSSSPSTGNIGQKYSSVFANLSDTPQAPATQTAQEAKGATTVAQVPAATQESPESLLVSLNSKMDQLIKATTKVVEINERQLSVQRGLGGNLMATI